MDHYDVIVLGGGSAGSAAASAAHKAGARTAMVNRDELGGLCILRGCMPTKALLASAHAIHASKHLEPFGAKLEGQVTHDFARIMQRKQEQVKRFQKAKIDGIEADGYEVIFGHGRFTADDGFEIDGRRISADRFIIATGSIPARVDVPGLDQVPVWSSDDVMELTQQPNSLLVFGAGPIGLELALFFARIGTRVLLVNRSPLLHRSDPEAGVELTAALMQEDNFELAVPGKIEQLRPTDNGLHATIQTGDQTLEWEADAILMAPGRHPALQGLGLEHVNLDPDATQLEYDEQMRTSNPKIYVAGDATGSYQILHHGTDEGTVAGHNAAGAKPEKSIDYRLKMSVIFTDPPFAQVGLNAIELQRAGRDFVTGSAHFPKTGRAITMSVEHGVWKMFADPTSGEILGATILGPRADDLIHLISVLMHHRATADSILRMPWYHPTLSEVILNLAREIEAQRSSDGEH